MKKFLWPRLKSRKDGIEALRNCQIISFYLVFSYGLNTITTFKGLSLWSGALSEFDKTFLPLGYLLVTVLFLWFGFRIRNNKFGLVPIISIWYICESLATILVSPTPGQIFLRIFFILISFNCLRAWIFNRKF
jgi:hypothetical protein